MKLLRLIPSIATAIFVAATGHAQIPADLVAGPGIPAGNTLAPHTPSGMLIIGTNIWVGDEAQGLRHYLPVDPNNTDPVNTGQLMFDADPEFSIGGGTACVPWCSVGQVVPNGSTLAFVAIWDHAKGQPGQVGGPGVWMLQIAPTFGNFFVFEGASPLAPTAGLSGDQPTAIAMGPEGKLYVGFLKNGNIKRITNPSLLNPLPQNQVVESVGTTPNGRPMRAMAFLGADLYIATDKGLSVIHNAATCLNNTGGCGNAALINDGLSGVAHAALTTDGAGKVYFSAAGAVYRYTPIDGHVVMISSGYLFVDGHTNTLNLDAFGNLWIGDDPTDGLINLGGRLWRIPAARLTTIP